jgi:hypothetical protein
MTSRLTAGTPAAAGGRHARSIRRSGGDRLPRSPPEGDSDQPLITTAMAVIDTAFPAGENVAAKLVQDAGVVPRFKVFPPRCTAAERRDPPGSGVAPSHPPKRR